MALKPVSLDVGHVGRIGAVVLRPWRKDDAVAVLEAWADPDIARWTTHIPAPRRSHVDVWLEGRRQGWADEQMTTWAATEPDGKLLGSVGLKRLDFARLHPPRAHAEIMYWVVPTRRGQGLAAALATFVGRWAWAVLGLHRIELRHELDNLASCRVALRAGYLLEGVTRRSFSTPHGWVDEHLHAFLPGADDERGATS